MASGVPASAAAFVLTPQRAHTAAISKIALSPSDRFVVRDPQGDPGGVGRGREHLVGRR